MCLFRDKDNEKLLLKQRKPNDWIIIWKIVEIFNGKIITPFQETKINSQVFKRKEKKTFPPLGTTFTSKDLVQNNDVIAKGAIHAYFSRSTAYNRKLYATRVIKAYVQVKNIVGVGKYDVACKQITFDDKQWKKLNATLTK